MKKNPIIIYKYLYLKWRKIQSHLTHNCTWNEEKIKQEGHDGPDVAHLYIGPQSGASLNPRAFIWTNLEDTH
jgi:hypothetical protein